MTLSLLCLGVGNGSSHAFKGEPSTSFALMRDDAPLLLVDAGGGVIGACLDHLGLLPHRIYITHNHADHAAELPILLANMQSWGRKAAVYGHSTVLEYLKIHRMHGSTGPYPVDEVADWIGADEKNHIDLGEGFSLQLHQGQHRYLCYGFVLIHEGRPILGYTGDSAYDEAHYSAVTAAPVAVVDGREIAGNEHAGFDDIESFAARVPDCSIYVVHYGQSDHQFSATNVQLLKPGMRISL